MSQSASGKMVQDFIDFFPKYQDIKNDPFGLKTTGKLLTSKYYWYFVSLCSFPMSLMVWGLIFLFKRFQAKTNAVLQPDNLFYGYKENQLPSQLDIESGNLPRRLPPLSWKALRDQLDGDGVAGLVIGIDQDTIYAGHYADVVIVYDEKGGKLFLLGVHRSNPAWKEGKHLSLKGWKNLIKGDWKKLRNMKWLLRV